MTSIGKDKTSSEKELNPYIPVLDLDKYVLNNNIGIFNFFLHILIWESVERVLLVGWYESRTYLLLFLLVFVFHPALRNWKADHWNDIFPGLIVLNYHCSEVKTLDIK